MKKFLSLFLIITFLFCSCASTQDSSQFDKETPESNQSNITSNSTIRQESNTNDSNNISNEKPLLSFNSQDEFNTYAQSHKFPYGFLLYHDVEQFGNFLGLVFYDNTYLNYQYTLQNGNNRVYLRIKHESQPLEITNVLPLQTNADLRICPGTSIGTEKFTHRNIQYTYINGTLLYVDWNSGGIHFNMEINPRFSEYTGNDSTINTLLNKNTAYQVKSSVDTMVASKTRVPTE